jgi:hypothetical protein
MQATQQSLSIGVRFHRCDHGTVTPLVPNAVVGQNQERAGRAAMNCARQMPRPSTFKRPADYASDALVDAFVDSSSAN